MKNRMYNYHTNDHMLLNIIVYIFAFLTIMSNSIFVVSIGKIGPFIKLSWAFVLIILFIYSFIHLSNNNLNIILLFLSIFISCILLFLMLNYSIFPFVKNYLFPLLIAPVMLIVYFAYCLQSSFNTPLFFYEFENLMLILAVISLLFWTISLIGIPSNMSITSSFGSNFDGTAVIKSNPGYFGIYFVPQQNFTSFFGINLMRNSGIFIEGPVYSAMLNIALFIELFLRSNKKIFNFKTILFIVTLITTTSTNGILVALFTILCSVYLSLNNSRNRLKGLLLLFMPFIIMLIILVVKTIIGNKFSTSFNSSYALRMNDIFSALAAWRQHLFLGNGLGNVNPIIQHMNPMRWTLPGGTGISTGLTTELAYGGIIHLIIYLLPMILSSRYSKKIFAFSICLIFLFILQNISSYYIFIIILSYFWIYFLFYKYK